MIMDLERFVASASANEGRFRHSTCFQLESTLTMPSKDLIKTSRPYENKREKSIMIL